MSDPIEIRIRRATPHDFVNILRLLEIAVQDNFVHYPPINTTKILKWIMETKDHGEIIVADCSKNIVGVLGLMAKEWPWSEERYITNEFFFVMERFRPRGTADNLIKAAEKFADESKTRLVMGFTGGKKAWEKDLWMERKGYIYGGGLFHRLP